MNHRNSKPTRYRVHTYGQGVKCRGMNNKWRLRFSERRRLHRTDDDGVRLILSPAEMKQMP